MPSIGLPLGELLRVADEVRVFPLLAMDGMPSPHLEPLLAELRRMGHHVALRRVDYEVMRGGDRMLLVRRGRSSGAFARLTSQYVRPYWPHAETIDT